MSLNFDWSTVNIKHSALMQQNELMELQMFLNMESPSENT